MAQNQTIKALPSLLHRYDLVQLFSVEVKAAELCRCDKTRDGSVFVVIVSLAEIVRQGKYAWPGFCGTLQLYWGVLLV